MTEYLYSNEEFFITTTPTHQLTRVPVVVDDQRAKLTTDDSLPFIIYYLFCVLWVELGVIFFSDWGSIHSIILSLLSLL